MRLGARPRRRLQRRGGSLAADEQAQTSDRHESGGDAGPPSKNLAEIQQYSISRALCWQHFDRRFEPTPPPTEMLGRPFPSALFGWDREPYMVERQQTDRSDEQETHTALLLRIISKLETIDSRTSGIDERTESIEQTVHRQGTLLDSGLRTVNQRCSSLADNIEEHRLAVDALLAAKLAPPLTWRERLNQLPDEEKAAAAASVVVALLLARRQSRRLLSSVVERVPTKALVLTQLAAAAVLLTSQAADNVHALPFIGHFVGRPSERPRRVAQGCFAGASAALQWKLVLVLVAASRTTRTKIVVGAA